MKSFFGTIINGYLLLLFPLVMTIFLLEKLHHILLPLVQFIEKNLHVSRILGVFGVIIISAVLMLLLGYLCGILVKSPFIRKEIGKFEEMVLLKIPIYNLLKSVFDSGIGTRQSEKFLPALLSDGDQSYSLCYVTNQSGNFYTVYVCEGGLNGGELRIVPQKFIKVLDMKLVDFTRLVKQYGVNSACLVEQLHLQE